MVDIGIFQVLSFARKLVRVCSFFFSFNELCIFESSWWKIPNDNYFLQTTAISIPVYFLLFYTLITKEKKKLPHKNVSTIFEKRLKNLRPLFPNCVFTFCKGPTFFLSRGLPDILACTRAEQSSPGRFLASAIVFWPFIPNELSYLLETRLIKEIIKERNTHTKRSEVRAYRKRRISWFRFWFW